MAITVGSENVEDEGSSLLSFDPGTNREISLFPETQRLSLEQSEYRVMALMSMIAMIGTIMLVVEDYQGWAMGIGTVLLILVFVMASQWCLTKLPKWQRYVGTGFMWIAATYTLVKVYLRSHEMIMVALSFWLSVSLISVFVGCKSPLLNFFRMVLGQVSSCCNKLGKSIFANTYGHAFAVLAVISANYKAMTESSWFVSISSFVLNFGTTVLALSPYISFAVSSVHVSGRFDEARKERELGRKERENIMKTAQKERKIIMEMIDLRGKKSDLLLEKVIARMGKANEEKVAKIQQEIQHVEEEIASNAQKIAKRDESDVV